MNFVFDLVHVRVKHLDVKRRSACAWHSKCRCSVIFLKKYPSDIQNCFLRYSRTIYNQYKQRYVMLHYLERVDMKVVTYS